MIYRNSGKRRDGSAVIPGKEVVLNDVTLPSTVVKKHKKNKKNDENNNT